MVDFPASHVSFRGVTICRQYSGMIFPSRGGLIHFNHVELCEIDSDRPLILTRVRHHTHLKPLVFFFPRRCIGCRAFFVDLTQLMMTCGHVRCVLPGVLNAARLLLDNFRLLMSGDLPWPVLQTFPTVWLFWKVWIKRDVSEEILSK